MNPVATQCPECCRPLGLVQRLRKSNFCSPGHREAWLAKLDSAILDRLGARPAQQPAGPIVWTNRETLPVLALTPGGQRA